MDRGQSWVGWWYRGAAIYGILVLIPQYFRAPGPGAEAMTYGFIGTALAFQLAFWVIGGDPRRYHALMPVSIVEKAVFAIPVTLLYAADKAPAGLLPFAAIDAVLGIGFVFCWRSTRAA